MCNGSYTGIDLNIGKIVLQIRHISHCPNSYEINIFGKF